MDMRYDLYRFADPLFYDTPARWEPAGSRFEARDRPTPDGWKQHEQDVWVALEPQPSKLPPQGWKIHVSALPENADAVLSTVWDYCVDRRIAFKFLRNRQILMLYSNKYASRASSGKLLTLYPTGTKELERVLEELGTALQGQQGPYVLSDLRWRFGPLYLRYGGFAKRYCVEETTGEQVLAIEDPHGRLVPDVRQPIFRVPDWVRVPDFLAPEVEHRTNGELPDFPYDIHEALHFSNGGGVYLADDTRTGLRVALKEARPFAGLDGDGNDAVTRLQREHRMLRHLAGLGVVPEVLGYETYWEHHFLAQEFVDGELVNRHIVRNYPFIRYDPSREQISDYTAWALDFLERVEHGLEVMHQRGIVYGDLHPRNLVLRADGRVVFLDMELAEHVDERRRPTMGAPGFMAPPVYTGFDRDAFSLACLRLHVFLPLTNLLVIDPSKTGTMLATITDFFSLPESFSRAVVQGFSAAGAGSPAPVRRLEARTEGNRARADAGGGDWNTQRKAMVDAILASATPEREDRLFPGDIEQFTYDGLCFAYGATGVLYALEAAGAGRYPDWEELLIRESRRTKRQRPGFYDGLHGVAYVLQHLGRADEAMEVLHHAMALTPESRGFDLFGGLAGIGLNLLHFTQTAGGYALGDVVRIAEETARHVERVPAGTVSTPASRAGLLHGTSGPALLFIRVYEETGEERFLDLAASALRTDLARCRLADDGTFQVDEGFRILPYLATGSAGIGMVLHEFLAHRDDKQFTDALAGIRRAASPRVFVNSGLFNGRAGLLLLLSQVPGETEPDAVVARHLRHIFWHSVPYEGNLAFAGDHGLRLSMDMATGTAGVLFALQAAHGRNGVTLPFLRRSAAGQTPGARRQDDISK